MINQQRELHWKSNTLMFHLCFYIGFYKEVTRRVLVVSDYKKKKFSFKYSISMIVNKSCLLSVFCVFFYL